MDERVTLATEVLEKITFAAKTQISRGLAEDFAITPHIETFLDSYTENVVTMVRQSILSQKLDEITVRYPAGWWQAVKDRFAPQWFKRRWPVEWHKTTIDVQAVYPKMALPGETHSLIARITSNGGAAVDGWIEYTT